MGSTSRCAFGERCREIGIHQSMGSKGDCFDIGVAESFFATLENDLLRRRCFATRQDARTADLIVRSKLIPPAGVGKYRSLRTIGR